MLKSFVSANEIGRISRAKISILSRIMSWKLNFSLGTTKLFSNCERGEETEAHCGENRARDSEKLEHRALIHDYGMIVDAPLFSTM